MPTGELDDTIKIYQHFLGTLENITYLEIVELLFALIGETAATSSFSDVCRSIVVCPHSILVYTKLTKVDT